MATKVNRYSFKRRNFIMAVFQCADKFEAWDLFEEHMLACRDIVGSDEPPFDRNRYTCHLEDPNRSRV